MRIASNVPLPFITGDWATFNWVCTRHSLKRAKSPFAILSQKLSKICVSVLFPALFRGWAGCLRPSHDWATNRLFWLSSADKWSWQQDGTSIHRIIVYCFYIFYAIFEEKKFIICMLVFMDDLTFFIKAHNSLNDRTHIIIHVNKTCYWIKYMDNIINLNVGY